MASHMKFFLEELLDYYYNIIKHSKPSSDFDIKWLIEEREACAERIFWKFAWFHEVILPVSFYAQSAQIPALA